MRQRVFWGLLLYANGIVGMTRNHGSDLAAAFTAILLSAGALLLAQKESK